MSILNYFVSPYVICCPIVSISNTIDVSVCHYSIGAIPLYHALSRQLFCSINLSFDVSLYCLLFQYILCHHTLDLLSHCTSCQLPVCCLSSLPLLLSPCILRYLIISFVVTLHHLLSYCFLSCLVISFSILCYLICFCYLNIYSLSSSFAVSLYPLLSHYSFVYLVKRCIILLCRLLSHYILWDLIMYVAVSLCPLLSHLIVCYFTILFAISLYPSWSPCILCYLMPFSPPHFDFLVSSSFVILSQSLAYH